MATNTLSNLQASIFRFCTDFLVTHPEFQFLNFDTHANEPDLPPGDLLGPVGLSLVFDESMIEVSLMIGISVETDTNLIRLNTTMGELLELLRPGQRIRLYDAMTGLDIGWMAIQNGTRLLPVSGSAAKPLQFVSLTMSTNLSFSPKN